MHLVRAIIVSPFFQKPIITEIHANKFLMEVKELIDSF